jgi:D-alanine-D-alanine ligase
MKPTAVILYNLPAQTTGAGEHIWRESDEGVLAAVDAVAAALEQLRVPCHRLGVRRLADIPAALQTNPGAVVFNLVERLDGRVSDFNLVPAICEALGHPYTGSPSECLFLTLDKWLAKARLRACGVATPAATVVPIGAALDPRNRPPAPLIVKPLSSDGSEGIDAQSLVADDDALHAAVRRVHERSGQPALVEAYIEGREFNLSLFERGGRVEVMPLAEIDFALFPTGRPHIVDYDVKWIPGTIPGHVSPRKVPADVDEPTARLLRDMALRAWTACECRDYVRVDFRVDTAGRAFVLEVNANPDVSPKAGFPAALAAAGIPFAEFVRDLLRNAVQRGL